VPRAPPLPLELDPGDVARRVQIHHRPDRQAQALQAAGDGLELHARLVGAGRAGIRLDRAGQVEEVRREGVLDEVGVSEPVCLPPHARHEGPHALEEIHGRGKDLAHPAGRVVRAQRPEPPALPAGSQHAQVPQDTGRPHVDAEVGRGHVLEAVGLVRHQDVVGRQDGRPLDLEGHVRDEEGVVDDDEVGRGGGGAREPEGAHLAEPADRARAVPLLGAHGRPHRVRRARLEVLEGEECSHGGGRAGMQGDLAQGFPLPVHLEEVGLQRLDEREPAEAEVVAPALEEREGARLLEQGGQKGDVLADELLLEGDGAGGDHGALEGALAEEERGEVGERLAHPRARLHHQAAARGEGALHGRGHGGLLGPDLVTGHGGGEQAARAEYGMILTQGRSPATP